MTQQIEPRTLYLVGTPIGNLEDITLRAIRILQEVDLIAAEDTRHTGKLLQHLGITTPQLSYHAHNQQQRIGELLGRLQEGGAIALVTDAGMPGISDPGYELVRECVNLGLAVVPIPGVTAAITALVASGMPTESFIFEGFLPSKKQQRQEKLKELQGETRTLIFYEAPHRLIATLTDLGEAFGCQREIAIARELTKLNEEFWRGSLEKALELYQHKQPRGEYTLVVAGKAEKETLNLSVAELQLELQQLLAQGMTRSQASKQLASLTSLSRRQIYQLSLKEEET